MRVFLPMPLSRRKFLSGLTGAFAAHVTTNVAASTGIAGPFSLENVMANAPLDKAASDESYWRDIAHYYDRTEGIINLEHGYWGKMARPVKEIYLEAIDRVNQQNSYYARKGFGADMQKAIGLVAAALGAKPNEIAITENATESFHSLVRQYRHFKKGDGVLMADVDYPQFKKIMRWQAEQNDGPLVEVTLPDEATQDEIAALYIKAFDANPKIKLMLITHVSNQHGLVIPVRRIAAEARKRGITVICDAAQSWGLLNFTIDELGVDFAAFNLHKWIGAPLGLGALYIREGSIDSIAPFPGEAALDNKEVRKRVHRATWNFAAGLALPAALKFHNTIGPAKKEARLRYLRNLWVEEARSLPHIQVLGGKDAASSTGMGSFRLAGRKSVDDAKNLQQRLEQGFGIFTVIRDGLASGACVRVTPQVFTSPDEIEQLVSALKVMG